MFFCPGRPLPGRSHRLPGEGAGEGSGAERSLAANQRGVPEGHPAGGRAVVGRLPPGPPPLLLLPGRPRKILPEREQGGMRENSGSELVETGVSQLCGLPRLHRFRRAKGRSTSVCSITSLKRPCPKR